MLRQIPIGTDDFRVLRERNYEYVDKTHLITELVDSDNIKVVLLPRPRRFGKSLNLSTMKWFFEKREEDVWHLFDGLHVARAGAKYRGHFQKYPVIHISLKETKAASFDACVTKARAAIRGMYAEHLPAVVGKLDPGDEREFQAILNDTASNALHELAIGNLTKYLHQVHGVRPIVLIDEYDAGIHASYANGFYKEAIGFFGGFFLAGLKDNVHLERAVMTGILRVSRESIFSDLNNLGVYTLLRREFNTCFGFTEAEVTGLMEKAGLANILPAIRSYYNGYEFGGADIYNPWSILSFLASAERQLIAHWVGTSSNLLIQELLQHHAFGVQDDIQTLLEGGYIERHLDENVVFPRLKDDRDVLWNLLVFSGYLKAARPGPPVVGEPPPPYRLSIPNVEVASVYRTTFQRWMDQALVAQGGGLQAMLEGMLGGDTYAFEEQLQRFAATLPSYHDVRGARPETFYHGMMIGLLASLEPDYEVRSNRESGDGRPDVFIKPRRPGKPGVVLELKAARQGEKTIEKAMAEGLTQLASSDYAAELRAAGVEKIREMAVAFDGKRVMVLPKGAKAPVKKAAVKKPAKKSTATKTVKKAAAKKVTAKAKKTR
ncbi:MAG: AAA family ATPase [Polyangiaceae bacterium]|nr:AAA family ATPase [Polyangiaceae bacterium]